MTATESGRVQVVYTANVGSPLAADVAAGATVITVDDTSDFDTDGTLQVAGQTVAYSAVDDDTGQVTLTGAVTGAADAGDIVTLWDTGLDQAAVEYRAHVALPGVLDNADAVDATIRHTLIGYLDEGIRNPGTGESVRMERHGLDWVIVDLLGKRPAFSGGGGGGGPVAAARFEDPEDFTLSYGSGGIRPSHLNPGAVVGDPSCWVYNGTFGVRFAVEGWYQASADGHVWGLDGGDTLSITVLLYVTNWFGEVSAPAVAAETGTPGNSNVWLSATSPVFWARANDYVEMSVNTVSLTSSSPDTVIERCGINLVRFEAGGVAGGGTGGGTGGGGAAGGTASMTLAATPTAAAATAAAGMTLAAAGTGAAAPAAATGTASMTLAAAATAAAAPAAATGTASMTLAASGTAGVPTTSVYRAAVLADAPVLYLRLGEATGTVAADSSTGTPVNGTYQNSPTLAQPGLLDADPDTAVQFTGTAQVSVTPTSKLNPPGTAYTVECWVQHLGAAASNQYAFRWLGSGGLCALGLNSNGCAEFTVVYSFANSNAFTSPPINMRDGQPHHLVGVRDADNVYLYIDGTLAVSGTRTSMNNTSSNTITIGNDGSGVPFGGTIDEVAFYPSALSATRVAAHYTAGLGARAKPVWVADVASSGVTFTSSLVATLATAPGTGDVLVASVQHPGVAVNSVAGCGATWVKAFGQSSGQANDFWIGTGATTTGAITAALSGAINARMDVLLIRNLTAATVQAAHCEQGSIVSPGTPTASSTSDTSAAGRIVIAPQTVSNGFQTTLFATLTPALGWGSNAASGGNAMKWRVSLGSESVSTSVSTVNTSPVDYGIGQLVLGP